MNWLLDNPISEMPGPMFLALYASVIVFVFAEAFYKSRRADRSEDLGLEPIPTKPDPLEIAYLRGGVNEATRLLVFDLMTRGYLRVTETPKSFGKGTEKRIDREVEPPDLDGLSPVERKGFDFFNKPRKPEDLFRPHYGLTSELKARLAPLEASLRDRQLLPNGSRYSAAWRIWFGGAIMILAFGGFKLAVALSKGRYNVAFLIVFAFVGLLVLGGFCAVPRMTRRGKDYLKRLRVAFEGLKPRLAEASGSINRDPALVLVPAVFGVAVLRGTAYANVPSLFPLQAASTSGCGGGLAAAGCGGAAGGGGCGGGSGGGCGGGGCGGCGS